MDSILVAARASLHNPPAGSSLVLTAIGTAALVLGTAVAILVVRPRLATADGVTSFIHWAKTTDPERLRAELAQDDAVKRLHHLSRICRAKMVLLRASTDLTPAAGTALALAALVSGACLGA